LKKGNVKHKIATKIEGSYQKDILSRGGATPS